MKASEALMFQNVYVLTGTAVPDPCIEGNYCPNGTGLVPVPCPVNTYLNETGANFVEDCKPCEKGYICNQTGESDFLITLCFRVFSVFKVF